MTNRPGINFSFSGLKTFAMNTWSCCNKTEQDRADIALAFQTAAIDTLVIKCRRALRQTNINTLVIAGGVSANEALRTKLYSISGINVHYPRPDFCSDNAAMIAFAGAMRGVKSRQEQSLTIDVKPHWPISELNPP